jgi:hypothetical protein
VEAGPSPGMTVWYNLMEIASRRSQ